LALKNIWLRGCTGKEALLYNIQEILLNSAFVLNVDNKSSHRVNISSVLTLRALGRRVLESRKKSQNEVRKER
jgi:hypothetical protein